MAKKKSKRFLIPYSFFSFFLIGYYLFLCALIGIMFANQPLPLALLDMGFFTPFVSALIFLPSGIFFLFEWILQFLPSWFEWLVEWLIQIILLISHASFIISLVLIWRNKYVKQLMIFWLIFLLLCFAGCVKMRLSPNAFIN